MLLIYLLLVLPKLNNGILLQWGYSDKDSSTSSGTKTVQITLPISYTTHAKAIVNITGNRVFGDVKGTVSLGILTANAYSDNSGYISSTTYITVGY